MMEEGGSPSLASVVQNIMETLSDAVNQLILLVIALQEQNSAMPAHIPPATEAVASAANTLTEIARDLANDEYADYSDIQGEIIEACDEMDSSAQGLIKAVQNIQKTNDRKAGWEGLLQASKIISGKTIRILEIVYGAEIKRLLYTAEQTQKLLAETDAAQAVNDPEAFAQRVGELASKAGELASQVTNKAADEEAPLSRKNLERTGDDIRDRSERLVSAANELLENPNDAAKRKKFDDEMKALEKDMQAATNPMKEKLQEITHSNVENMFQNMTAEPVAQKESAHQPAPTAPVSKRASQAIPVFGSPTIAAIVNENAGLADVARAAIRKDADGVATAAKALAARTEDLVDKLKDTANGLPAEAKSGVLGTIDQLQRHAKDGQLASANVAKAPAKRDVREKLADALNKMDDDVVAIADSPAVADPDKLQIYAQKEKGILDVLGDAVAVVDPNEVVEGIRKLVACQQKLIPLAVAESQRTPEPERQAQIGNAAQQLLQLLPKQVQAAKAVLEGKGKSEDCEQISDKMQDALDAILGAARPKAGSGGSVPAAVKDGAAEAKHRVKQAKEISNKLAEAGAKGDTRAVEAAIRDLAESHKPLASKARNAAQVMPASPQKTQVLDALRDLDALLPQQAEAARDLARNPHIPGKRAKLEELNRKVDNDLNSLASALADTATEGDDTVPEALKDYADSLKAQAKKQRELGAKLAAAGTRGDVKAVEKVLKDISDAHKKPAAKARSAADKIKDPRSKEHVIATLDELDSLLPQQGQAAHDLAGAPKDPAKKAQLDKLSDRIVDDFAALARELEDAALSDASGSRERPLDHEVGELLHAAAKAAKGVEAAAKKGDIGEVKKAAKESTGVNAKLAPKAIAAAAESPVPFADHQVKRVMDSLQKSLQPKQEESALKVAQDQADHGQQEALRDATAGVLAALDSVRDNLTGATPASQSHARSPHVVDPELDHLIEKAKEDARKVEDAVRSPQDVTRAAKDAKESSARLGPKAQAAAIKSSAPNAENGVTRALDKLQSELLPKQEELAKKAAQKPGDQGSKDDLKAATDDVVRALDGIRDAITGAPQAARDAALDARGQSQKAKDLSSKLAEAGAKGDSKAVNDALQDLHDAHAPLAANAYDVMSKIHDPVRQHQVLEALAELDALLPQQSEAAKDLASHPHDPHKKDRLANLNRDIARDLDVVSDALADVASVPILSTDPEVARLAEKEKALAREVAAAATASPPADVGQAARKLAQAHAHLAPKAIAAAQNAPNPSAEPHVRRLLDHIEKEALPKQEAVAREVAKDQNSSAKKDQLKEATDNIGNSLDDILDAIGGESAQQAVKDAAVKSHAQSRKQKALGDKLADAALKGNLKGVAQAAKDINDNYQPLRARANRAAQRTDDPKAAQRALKALRELDNLVPKQEEAAHALARNPKDPSKKAELDAINQQIAKELDALNDALNDAANAEPAGPDLDLDALLRKAQDEAYVVPQRTAGPEVGKATKDIKDTYAKLAPKAKAAARSSPHAFAEPRVAQALHELQYYLMPQQEELAQRLAEHPNDEPKKKQLKDVTDKIYDALEDIRDALAGEGITPEATRDAATDAKSQCRRAKQHARDLAKAGAKEDPKGVDQALKDLHETYRPLQSKARKAAEVMKDHEEKARVLDALADLASALPEQEAAARDLARTPKDPVKKGKLEDANRRVANALDTIADAMAAADAGASPHGQHAGAHGTHAVDPEINKLIAKEKDSASKADDAAKKANLQDVARALKDIKDTHAQLAPKATAASKKLPNPGDSHHVQKALDHLANQLIPKQEELANHVAHNPADEPKKDELQAATDKIKDELDALREALKGSPSPAALKDMAASAKQQAKKCKDAGPQLAAAAAKGDKRGVDQALKDIKESHAPLKSKAKALAAKSPPHQAQPILDALADLDSLLPQQEQAARDLSRNPRDPARKSKLDALNDKVGRDFDFLSDALAAAAAAAISGMDDPFQSTSSSPHIDPELQHLINKAKDDIGKAEAAALKPAPSSQDAAKWAKEARDTVAQLAPKAQAAATTSPFPQAGAHVKKALGALQKELLPKHEEAVKDAIREPKANAKKDEVKDGTKKIKDALDSIAAALAGGSAVPQSVRDNSGYVKARAAKAKELGYKLSDAGSKGDMKTIDQALKDIKEAQNPIIAKSKAAASQLPPAQQQRVLDALADLDALLPQQDAAARDLARNPRDSSKKGKLDALNKQIAKDLDVLGDALGDGPSQGKADAPDKVRQHTQKQQGLGAKLASAAAAGDRAGVDKTLRDVEAARAQLADDAHHAPAPSAQRIADALADLDSLLPVQASAARDAAAAPRDKKKQHALDKLNEKIADKLDDLSLLLGDIPKDELDGLIQQQREKVGDVLVAATEPHSPNSQPHTEAATKAASDVFAKLTPKAKAAPLNPPARKAVDKGLEDLSALIPAQSFLALNAAAHPTPGGPPAALRDTTNRIEEALAALSGALAADALQKEAARVTGELRKLIEPLATKRADAVTTQLSNAVAALSTPPSLLLPLARRVAQHISDPEAKKKLLEAVDEAARAFPAITEALKEGLGDAKSAISSPAGTTAPLRELENAQRLVDKIAALGNAASPVEESVAIASKASDALADLLDAARRGDTAGVERASEKLANLQPKLIRTARAAADTLSDPNRKKKLFGAIDQLDDVLPAAVKAARGAAQEPHNQGALQSAVSAGGIADGALNKIADESGLNPLAAGEKLLDDLDDLLQASARSDPEEMMQAVKDFVNHQPDFSFAAKGQADAVGGDNGNKIHAPVTKIDNDVKALLNAAHEVIKDPTAEAPKKKLAKNVAEMRGAIQAASEAIRNAPPPAFFAEPEIEVDELTDLVPALLAAAEAARDNPNDSLAQQRLEDALDKLSKPLENYLDESASPADQAAACADVMSDGLNALVQAAVKGDVPQVERLAKELGGKQANFADKMKQAAGKLKSPERKAQATGAVDDVAHLVPKLVAVAKQVAQNPKDQPTQKQLQNLNRVANDGLNLAKNAVKHTRAVKDAKTPEKADRRLKLCGVRGNSPADDAEAIRRLKGTIRQLDAMVKDEPPDWLKGRRIAEAIADLEKKLQDKHGSTALEPGKLKSGSGAGPQGRGSPSVAARGSPQSKAGAAPVTDKDIEAAKKKVEAEIDLVRKKKHTPLQASIHDAGDGIRKLRIAAYLGDPQRAATDTKAALGKQGRVAELAKLFAAQVPDPVVKRKAEDAVRELEKLIPQQENLAKTAAANKDPKHWESLDDATVKAEAAIATIGELVNPTPGTTALALAKKAKAEVPKLLDAAKAGDSRGVDESVKAINDLNKKLADVAKQEVSKSGEPENERKLDDSLNELAASSAKLASAVNEKAHPEQLANIAKQLYDPLDTVADIVNDKYDTPDSDGGSGSKGEEKQQEAKKQARVILATMKPKAGAKINPNHLIKASQHLAGLMEDLVGKTKVEAHSQKEKGNLTERARAALELDDLLSSMEASAKASAAHQRRLTSSSTTAARPAAIQSLESVLASLTAIASSVPDKLTPIQSSSSLRSSSATAPSQPRAAPGKGPAQPAKPVSLTDSIIKVAKDIQTRAGTDTDPVSVVNRDLAAELQRFAKADQERRRQDMLISGRAISTHITRLIAEIKTVAAQCRDPVLQDKLLKHAQTLRNFGIQLKILASVKAAAADDSSNNSQLATLTESLGNVLSDVSTTMTIMKKSKKV